ncbi:MAG: MBL fold metallo-hydrolase [Candidatus Marinimicrobia bacterium]|jgi:glyoxylase-like metal-dependent hydrolase (beta-lactamase superfamily II)|nr:MBL fold metallo-hydrolase [Candidatus Neomarinimicrobiota bacterium]MBT3676715.1 MBL fold metallo-hydrolase [Candidatus Neomarinimicrobiota bacterium]MBT3764183.1 MBL fold metallo-hydrolase [Candidatus Neomarinimicrobiota bacterium]MBT4068508.1 MBL fold metallo-hydrolase [Candidatus Neomarinimicrobiota bacterium]MBT4271450.1 MBL fold metallo-hydrolase [Candidatus Neomarinimicrobiota bacterium]
MNIGGYDLYSIETSVFALDGGAMFGIIPKPLWEKEAPADDQNRITMVTRSLLLVGHGRKIIVDTGNGNKWQDKFKAIYNIDTETVNLNSSLAKHNFTANEITDVFCTHMHFDHIGGNTKFVNGKLEPVFPNATYWMQNENWDLANSPSEKDQGSFMEADWSVLAENGMIKIVDGKESFLPEITMEMSYGHTTGMMLPKIQDSSNTIVYMADLIPMAAHIPLPWVMAYDILPVLTVQEKQLFLPKAVDENWILFFEHDPVHQACTVHFDGKHYRLKESVTISG